MIKDFLKEVSDMIFVSEDINIDKTSKVINSFGGKNVININGNTYSGSNLVIKNNEVYIDGKKARLFDAKQINISVDGDIKDITCDVCEKIHIKGDVKGYVKSTNGNVVCGDIGEYAKTTNGNIKAKTIHGNCKTTNGDINT